MMNVVGRLRDSSGRYVKDHERIGKKRIIIWVIIRL
ncbi:hypothetical protein Desde_2672 [Desulfitobacterium dehalogenans ATCC 51507]|uniref:Uncharacterized protein n=1 Tax=Desulfitobacterium dehalogenans (strain ATCC 51507 / DSM 9161 / JW/IU-DC1) TaxID=756499 RepID=I4AAK3_DESDJ|nr:hypothetical protein Desde_2672 [Desulfitobacterium dehalogenans ATCC 51507]